MKYYLDTNIISYFIKGTYPKLLSKITSISSFYIVIPTIVLAELEYGARKCGNYQRIKEKYDAFTRRFYIEFFDDKAAIQYGIIRNQLEQNGTPISYDDMLIAAIVKANDGVLVTNNTKHFEKINDLKIENWTE